VAFTLKSLGHVAPFLLLSIAIAAYAQASGADNLIARAFQGRLAVMIPVGGHCWVPFRRFAPAA
jgi:hypothetical protein